LRVKKDCFEEKEMKRVKTLLSVLAFCMASAVTLMAAPYEVVWYVIGNGTPPDIAAVQDAANKYLAEKNMDATLKLVTFDWGTYDGKMQQIIASQQPFDISFTASWTNNFRLNAQRGAFLDITKLSREFAPKTMAALGDSFVSGSAIAGKNYAIPANKEKAHNWGFLIRKDLIDKYKLDTSKIKKFEDIEPLLKVIKTNEPEVYPLESVVGENPARLLDPDLFADDNLGIGLMNTNKSGKVIFSPATPEAKALYTSMRKFYSAGYIRKDAAAVTDYNADEKAGKVFAAIKSLKPGKDAEVSLATGYPWVQIDITPVVMTNRETIGSLQAISRTSKNPQKALQVLELFNSDLYFNNLINWGVEGKHYVKSDKMDATGVAMIKAGPDKEKYNVGTPWMFGNTFINYLDVSENPKKAQMFLDYNAKALPLKSLGFDFDISKVKNEVTAIKNVWAEFMGGLETGSTDPATELPKALTKFQASGLDKVVAEAQKQYDAWCVANKVKY
jgi:putative aldouronate transport system substrate-binding protein